MTVVPALTTVGQMRHGDHLLLGYDTDEERETVLAAFLLDGLASGHRGLLLPPADIPAGVALSFLEMHGCRVDEEVAVGRLCVDGHLAGPEGLWDLDEVIRREARRAVGDGFLALRVGTEILRAQAYQGSRRCTTASCCWTPCSPRCPCSASASTTAGSSTRPNSPRSPDCTTAGSAPTRYGATTSCPSPAPSSPWPRSRR